MRQGFNTTSGFQHTMPIFYAPAQAIPRYAIQRIILDCMSIVVSKNHSTACARRGILFLNVNNPKRYRRHFLKIGRRLQLCPYISNGYFGNTGCALTPCFLTFLFDSGALSGNLYGYRDCIGDCMTSSNSLFSPMVLRLCCARISKSTRELLRRWSSKISKNPPSRSITLTKAVWGISGLISMQSHSLNPTEGILLLYQDCR